MPAALVEFDALDVLTVPVRPSTAFFDALDQADKRIDHVEELAYRASGCPAVSMYAKCSCGSVFEIRRAPITLDDDDREAVADALGGLDVGDIVAGAINDCRDRGDHDAFTDWYDDHADCVGGDVL